ncbi:unnamed protein product [Arctogadus glacialis]
MVKAIEFSHKHNLAEKASSPPTVVLSCRSSLPPSSSPLLNHLFPPPPPTPFSIKLIPAHLHIYYLKAITQKTSHMERKLRLQWRMKQLVTTYHKHVVARIS